MQQFLQEKGLRPALPPGKPCWSRLLALLALLLMGGSAAWARPPAAGNHLRLPATGPLCGFYTIDNTIAASGTNYTSFASAVTDLNLYGVGCATTFTVKDGTTYTEKIALGSPTLNASLNATSTLTFVRSNTATSAPKITAPTGSAGILADAIVGLNGTDYVTFNGIDLAENASNTTQAAQMEAGYALWRTGSGATLDGCQNVAIRNCTITLTKPQSAAGLTTGIWSANTDNAGGTVATTSAVAATASGRSNTFSGNTVTNTMRGIVVQGFTTATLYDQDNTVGGTSGAAGNTVNNLNSGTSTSSEVYGILADYQNNLAVQYNKVDNIGNGGTVPTRELRCISFNSGTTGTIAASNNALTVTTAMTTVVSGIRCEATGLTLTTSNNSFTATTTTAGSSGFIYFMAILVSSPTANLASWTADGNTWDNNPSNTTPLSLTTTGTLVLAYNNNKTATINFTNNTARNITRTVSSGTFYGYFNGAGGPASTPALHTITGNTIQSIIQPSSSLFYGVLQTAGASNSRAQANISNNTIRDVSSGTGAVYGIVLDYGDNSGVDANTSTINSNTIRGLSSTVASSGALGVYGIYLGSTSSATSNLVTNVKVQSNLIGEAGTSGAPTLNGINNAGTAPVAAIYFNGGAAGPTLDFSFNVIKNVNQTTSTAGSASTANGIWVAAPASGNTTLTASSNTIAGVSTTNANSATGVYGMLIAGVGTSGTATVEDNTINGVTAANTATSVYGIRFSVAATANVRRNTIYTLSHTNTSTGAVYGLFFNGGTTFNISRNKVYDLASSATTTTVYGIYAQAGSTDNVSNNLVGDLRAPNSTAGNSLNGINLTNSGPYNVYHNTVYLNAAAAGSNTLGSTALQVGSGILDLRNNLLVNVGAAGGTNYTSALRRSVAASSSNTVATTNNNILYAGPASTYNVLYAEGSTVSADQTIGAYRARMAALGGTTPLRESSANTENPPFKSTTGSSADFLHIDPAVATLVESGGTPVSSVPNDYDNDPRNATAPDVGADEGSFTPKPAMSVSSLVYVRNGANTVVNIAAQLTTSLTITTADSYDALKLTSITFDLNGTNVADITNATLYVSASPTFSTATATALPATGSIASPSYTLTLTTPLALVSGSNYFYLTYDITPGAQVGRTVASIPTAVSFVRSLSAATLTYTDSSTPALTVSGSATAARRIVGPLTGPYTVGVAAGNAYPTITAALADLAFRGVSGAVTFLLTNAADTPYSANSGETFPFVIPPFAGASASNTVTIKPAAGVMPIVSGDSGGANTALFKLDGADFFLLDGSNTANGTTRDLTITNTTSQAQTAIVWVASQGTGAGATYLTVKNTNLVGTTSSAGLFGVFAGNNTTIANGSTGTGADNDNLTVQNNSFQTLAYGIYAGGTAAGSTAGSLDALTITGNNVGIAGAGLTTLGIQISNTGGTTLAAGAKITSNVVQNIVGASATPLYGIWAETGVPFVTISQNTVDGISQGLAADAFGIYASTGFTDGVVTRNRVVNIAATATGSYGSHGIDARTGSTASNLLIANNTVANITGSCGTSLSTTGISGIRLLGAMGGVKVYYNSVNLSGATTNTTASTVSAAFHTTTSATTAGTFDVRNNVFANSLVSPASSGAKNYAIYSGSARTTYASIDYNDYYVSGPNGVLGNYIGSGAATAGTDLTTLAAIQSTSSGLGQNTNSRNVVPGFVSPTDLHLANFSALESAGTSLVGVVDNDYDGDARYGNPSYAGTGTAPDLGSDEANVAPATALALSGVYTIDNTLATSYPGGRNFRSFTDAIAVLNQSTITASGTSGFTPAVTFNVTAGQTFAEDGLLITTLASAATTAVTFQKSGSGANPVLQPAGTALNSQDAGLVVQGSDYLTFDGIDASAPGGNVEFGYLVRNASATNGAFNNTVQNATVTLNRTNTAAWGILQLGESRYGGGFTPTSLAGCNQNNRYLNLQVYNAAAGIVALGYSTAYYDYNTEIANCLVGSSSGPIGGTSAFSAGINGGVNRKLSVHDNAVQYVSTTSTGGAAGLYFYQLSGGASTTVPADATTLYNNRISNISTVGAANTGKAWGVYLEGSTTAGNTNGAVAHSTNLYNNAVSGVTSGFTGTATSTRYVYGIFLTSGGSGQTSFSAFNVSFNTVSLNTGTPTYSSTCYEFSSASGATLNIRDNIFANFTGAQTGGANHYGYVSTSAGSFGVSGSVSDYNDFWVPNTTNGALALGNNTTRTDLAGLQANGEGTNSKIIDPVFDAILRPTNAALNGLGVTLAGITTDLVGTVRGTGTAATQTGPDMGAYEFPNTTNVALAVGALTSPAANYCLSGPASAPITVNVTNPSAVPLVLGLNQKLVLTGTLSLPGGGTQALSATLTSGTLPTGGTLAVSLGTVNLSAAGTYTFQSLTVALQAADGTVIPETSTTDNVLSPNPTVVVGNTTTWNGSAGTNWFSAANWSGCVPTRDIDATIPAGLTNYPVLNTNATAEVKSLTLANGSQLSQSAGTLTVYGSLTDNAPASDVRLTGGAVAFVGASPQLTGTGAPFFYNLNVNLGSGSLTLGMNAYATNAVTMQTGVLNTGTYTLRLDGATISETDASYVTGNVNTSRVLTAGTADNFGGLGLTLTPAANSTSPSRTEVTRVTGTVLTGQGTSQSIQRYFDIQPVVNTGLNVQMDFSYFDHERNGIPAANMQLFKSTTGTAGPWERQLGTSVSGNTVTKPGITDFSVWTLGNGDNPLPVQLVKFEAQRQGTDALLSWTTASELDNKGFEVQVSADGQHYRTLGFVAGAGSSSNTRTYGFVDREAGKAGARYYRLNQLDLSGKATYSPVRTLAFEVAGLLVQAMPNPFTNTLTVSLTLPGASATPVELHLTDALGRTVLHQSLPALPAGTTQAEVAGVSQLPAGVYLLRVTLDGASRTLKVVHE